MSSASDSESDTHRDDLLRIYTQLMLDSLDSAVLTSTPTPGHDAVEVASQKADGMNAKKRKLEKKKLKREETKRFKADLVEQAEFRLLSRQPVRTISLLPPKEEIRIVSNPRHVPWTDERLAARRNRIRSTVVDGKELLRTRPSNGHLKVNLRSTHYRGIQDITKVEDPTIYQQPVSTNIFRTETTPCLPPLPTVFHAERPKTSFSPYILKRDTISARVKPNRPAASSVHKITIPTLTSPWPCDSTVPQPTFPQTRADQRRQSRETRKLIRRQERLGIRTYSTSMSGKTRHVNMRPEARFWAPPVGLGAKARGYAYGYMGSREGAREEDAKWARDRMRVGCMAEVEEVQEMRRGKVKIKSKDNIKKV